ncbi:ParB/RepB/Spo0J family partition protein [Desulfolucanica intricata]|uniref:ParB/RepB/Spo0J family partition protein n=1 Tax=Desulfolucanica intricata TaxID=1285191 RepID=UPI00082B69AA|nr:ParB/RepB/Spo0J family partition protein [Desulfolucanica intricata]
MNKKRGLGKGLGALLPAIDSGDQIGQVQEKDNHQQLRYISVDAIYPNPRQARVDFNSEKLEELKKSINEHGVVQPIVVRPLPNGNYELIAGERRWRACKKLGLDQIPAIVKIYSDIEASAISLIENVQREDLNCLEEAIAYKKLMDTFGLTQEEVSNRVGKSRPFIANHIRLLTLPDEIKDMLIHNVISTGHAKVLLALEDPGMQIQVAEKIAENNLSVRDTEKLIKDILNKKETKKKVIVKDDYFINLENKLNNLFNTRVNIKVNKKGKGKIEIEYKNKDELSRILKLMNNKLINH